MEFSTKQLTPPQLVEKKTKIDLRVMKRILYDMGPLMASPESFEVWATLRTKIQAEKGPPHPKI